ADLFGVIVPCLLPGGVVGQVGRVGDVELFGEVDHSLFGDLGQVGEEGAQVAGGAQLHRVPEPVGFAGYGLDQRPVRVVQGQLAVQVRAGAGAGGAAVGRRLLIGAELNWHAPRR